jgi:hypothetical protein
MNRYGLIPDTPVWEKRHGTDYSLQRFRTGQDPWPVNGHAGQAHFLEYSTVKSDTIITIGLDIRAKGGAL